VTLWVRLCVMACSTCSFVMGHRRFGLALHGHRFVLNWSLLFDPSDISSIIILKSTVNDMVECWGKEPTGLIAISSLPVNCGEEIMSYPGFEF
jgi:hypothetical protein